DAMIPGNSPPLRNCKPASGSSASTSQSRSSVRARALKGLPSTIALEFSLGSRRGQQRRRAIRTQHVEVFGERHFRVKVQEMLLDCLLLESSCPQSQGKTRELPVGER